MKKLLNLTSTFSNSDTNWKKQNSYNIDQNTQNGGVPFKKFSSDSIIFHCLEWKINNFSIRKKQDQGKWNCLISKSLAKLVPRIQKLYQITYIFCNTLWSVFVKSCDTNLLEARGTLALQCICRAQLIIQTTYLNCRWPCNHVRSLLVYCRG